MDQKDCVYDSWLCQNNLVYLIGFTSAQLRSDVEQADDSVRSKVVEEAIERGAKPVAALKVDPSRNNEQIIEWFDKQYQELFEGRSNVVENTSEDLECLSPVKKKACASVSLLDKLTPKSKRLYGKERGGDVREATGGYDFPHPDILTRRQTQETNRPEEYRTTFSISRYSGAPMLTSGGEGMADVWAPDYDLYESIEAKEERQKTFAAHLKLFKGELKASYGTDKNLEGLPDDLPYEVARDGLDVPEMGEAGGADYAPDITSSFSSLSPFKSSAKGVDNHKLNDNDDCDDLLMKPLDWTETFVEVEVSNIPPPFMEELFMNFMRVSLEKGGFPGTAIQGCGTYCPNKKSVIIKVSENVAKEVCALRPKFLHNYLTLKCKGSSRSSTVKISNVPPPFVEELFVYYITGCFNDGVPSSTTGVPIVKKCGPYNAAEQSVVVKFADPKLASSFCGLKLDFLHHQLNAELVFDENADQSALSRNVYTNAEGPLLPPAERAVRFSTIITKDFDEDHFKSYIISSMKDASFIEPDKRVCDIIDDCVMDEKVGTARIVFKTSEFAQLAACLTDIEYRGNKITPCLITRDDVAYEKSTGSPKASKLIRTLEDPDGFFLFMKYILKTRHAFIPGKSHDGALARLHLDLKMKGVVTSVEELRSKRRAVKTKYNKLKKEGRGDAWEYFKVMAVIVGDAAIDTLTNTRFTDDDSDDSDSENTEYNKDVNAYGRDKSWTKDAVVQLIAICIKHKDEYHDVVNQSSFWRKASRELAANSFGRHQYHPDQCEALMKRNEKLYRTEQVRLDTSGAAGAVSREAWPLYRNMAPLMEKVPNIDPEITIAAGTSNKVHHRISPPPDKKHLTHIERQTLAMETMVKANEQLKKLLLPRLLKRVSDEME